MCIKQSFLPYPHGLLGHEFLRSKPAHLVKFTLSLTSYLLLVAADIQAELDGTLRTEVGAGAFARVLHPFNNAIGSLEVIRKS